MLATASLHLSPWLIAARPRPANNFSTQARAEAELSKAQQQSQGTREVSCLSRLLDAPEVEQLKADNAWQA